MIALVNVGHLRLPGWPGAHRQLHPRIRTDF